MNFSVLSINVRVKQSYRTGHDIPPRRLALTLLVARVSADDVHSAFPADDLTVFANSLNAGADFHRSFSRSIFSLFKGILPFSLEIEQKFIAAILTVVGYSLNDTIVVFDRVRENLMRGSRKPFTEIIDSSVKQTLARSINTSLTLVFVLVALLVVGPENLWYFVLTLLVGVLAGAYSSIFIASPLLLVLSRHKHRK